MRGSMRNLLSGAALNTAGCMPPLWVSRLFVSWRSWLRGAVTAGSACKREAEWAPRGQGAIW